jgi:hypothetical protein
MIADQTKSMARMRHIVRDVGGSFLAAAYVAGER